MTADDILRRLIPYFVQCEDCWGDGCDECNQDGGFFELTRCINDGTQDAVFAWRDRDKLARNSAAIAARDAEPVPEGGGIEIHDLTEGLTHTLLSAAKGMHALNRARVD